MKIPRIVVILAVIAVTIAVVFALFELGLLARDARRTIPLIENSASHSLGQIDITLTAVNSAMGDVHSIELETQRTEAEMAGLLNQTRHGMLTQRQEIELVAKASAVLDDSDATIRKVNNEFLPRINAVLESSNTLVVDGDSAVGSVSLAVHQLTADGHSSLAVLSDEANELRPSIEGFNQIVHSGTGIAGNLDATTSDIKAFVHRETTPVRGTWNVIKSFLREFAGPAAQVATAVK